MPALSFGLNEFRKTPVGFIPQVDRGYLIVVTQLPSGARSREATK
jgi:multidrug efflux pump subunit AcrB